MAGTGYTISIGIDSTGVKQINIADQFVTLVKKVTSGGSSAGARGARATEGPLPVAWVAFSPLEDNQLSWEEQYYLYGTDTILEAGVTIKQTSQTDGPASDGNTYPFQGGTFGSPTSGGPTGVFGVDNQEGVQNMSFGLAQEISVNGSPELSPINALRVLNNETATFQPYETVSIFLSGYDDNGVVLSNVAGDALTVEVPLGGTVNVGFDDDQNKFILK